MIHDNKNESQIDIEQFINSLLLFHPVAESTKKRLIRFFYNPTAKNAETLLNEEQTDSFRSEWSDGPNFERYQDRRGW